MNRRVSIALATAAATAISMTAPAFAQTTEPSAANGAGETSAVQEAGSSGSSGSSDASGDLGQEEPQEPEEGTEPTTTPVPEDYLCANGERPEIDRDAAPEKDTFLGPSALFEELTGSSIPGKATSAYDDGADEYGCTPEQQINLDDYPGWMHSSIAPSEDLKTAMAVIEAVMVVGMTLTQVAAITVPFVPGAREQLRDFLTSLGVNVDA